MQTSSSLLRDESGSFSRSMRAYRAWHSLTCSYPCLLGALSIRLILSIWYSSRRALIWSMKHPFPCWLSLIDNNKNNRYSIKFIILPPSSREKQKAPLLIQLEQIIFFCGRRESEPSPLPERSACRLGPTGNNSPVLLASGERTFPSSSSLHLAPPFCFASAQVVAGTNPTIKGFKQPPPSETCSKAESPSSPETLISWVANNHQGHSQPQLILASFCKPIQSFCPHSSAVRAGAPINSNRSFPKPSCRRCSLSSAQTHPHDGSSEKNRTSLAQKSRIQEGQMS